MTSLRLVHELPDLDRPGESPGAGLLTSDRGNLPLVAMTVTADIIALLATMTIRQRFRNPHDCPIEATYIFPLPDRAAVTDLAITVGSRRIAGVLQERQAARDAYVDALAAGQRAALLEEDRPDVFTTRIGNIAPGEEATVELTLAGPVPCELGEATFRVPLVVAPRYTPGRPLDGEGAGEGTALDTDAVPDASRITPPALLPGSINPVQLALTVGLDPAGMAVSDLRSSLHAVVVAGELPGPVTVELRPGERLDRDFVLRYRVATGVTSSVTALAIPDETGTSDGTEGGTYVVTVMPPVATGSTPARDVVLVLDRSGSMGGWKMVAARRAAARIVDSLTRADRFAVIAFDHEVERPTGLSPDVLVEASDRNRYQAIEWLARLESRGGTEMASALRAAHAVVAGRSGPGRIRCCILVTDGQVGNEDQLVRLATDAGVRMFTVGIDRAVNAGLLRRLAAVTGGRCDLVESEDRLDDVLADLQRRIGHPVLESVTVRFEGLIAEDATMTPSRPADLFPGVPLVVSGRFRGRPGGRAIVSGHDGTTRSCDVLEGSSQAAAPVWARAHLRELEDRYAARSRVGAGEMEVLAKEIVSVSLRHRVLCRFTAWVAVDQSGDRVEGPLHRIVQPVEMPSGWAPSGWVPSGWTSAGAPMTAVPMRATFEGGVTVPPPSPTPHQPQPAPGSQPPTGMATPNATAGKVNGRRRRSSAPEPGLAEPGLVEPGLVEPGLEAPGLVEPGLEAYRPRLEELLGAVDDRGESITPSDGQRLAAEARLLASDIASVIDQADLVSLLEVLAAMLTAGEPAAIADAIARLRAALAQDEGGRSARRHTKPFWR
jgi:Ca-activated chloride channel family protein